MPLWRARLIIQDALIKRTYDTLIDTLESKIAVLETKVKVSEKDYRDLLNIKNEEVKKQSELTTLESSMKEYFKSESKKYKRQRNIAYGLCVAAVGYIVFKPP